MFQQISLTEAQKLINNGNLYVLDVRDKIAYDAACIQPARHLTPDNLPEFCATADKTKPVLVYCYLGVSSQRFAHYLTEQGFSTVYSLEGGFEAWKLQHAEKNN